LGTCLNQSCSSLAVQRTVTGHMKLALLYGPIGRKRCGSLHKCEVDCSLNLRIARLRLVFERRCRRAPITGLLSGVI
jgi:hypothetical protein